MSRITSLRIDWYDNGLACGDSIVHQAVSVYRNKLQVTYRGYNAISKEPIESFDISIDAGQCEVLFSLLESAESAKDFEQDFSVQVCDGSAWDMRLRHSDNRINLITGTVEYPKHGAEIERYIRDAIGRAFVLVDPMIFGCQVYAEEEDSTRHGESIVFVMPTQPTPNSAADVKDDDIILGMYDKPKKKKEHNCPGCGSWMFETRYGTWECSRCDTEQDEDELEDE